jgi:hypothetical protein
MSIVPNENDRLGTAIAKDFALSTVTTIGVLTGMIVVGFAMSKVENLKKKRADKKAAKNSK